MDKTLSRLIVPASFTAAAGLIIVIAVFRPGYLTNAELLGALVFVELLIACLWRYRIRFFPALMMVFLLAGAAIPFQAAWTAGRWLALLLAALAGMGLYMKESEHRFHPMDMAALFSAIAAFVSAAASAYPRVALLKALSLFLLFLFAVTGARFSVKGHETSFMHGVILAIEGLVYVTAASYVLADFKLFGNPNSLGAIMGVVVVPLLLWSTLVPDNPTVRRRRIFALVLALYLLLFSLSRASILAGLISCIVLCLATRRYQVLMKGAVIVVALAIVALTVAPPVSEDTNESFPSLFLYKGKRQTGLMGSRRSPWQATMAVISEHPYFGSGFGTSTTNAEESAPSATYSSSAKSTREHGNSYLAITEWVGLLGLAPFVVLLGLLSMNIFRVLRWIRRSLTVNHISVPLTIVLIAGLIHSGFEDWLFAVGYYLSVFFWTFAFVLADEMPSTPKVFSAAVLSRTAAATSPAVGMPTSTR